MRTYDCPSCGATLPFASSVAVSAVCPFCRSLVIRGDLQVETLGTLAQLPPDLSPLQIGTTGTFEGTSFRLAGRLRWKWDGGSWTEWYAELANGEKAWLAETQGFFTFSRARDSSELPEVATLTAGNSLLFGSKTMTVIDIKQTVCVGGEGELPKPVPQGTLRLSADLQGKKGEFATLEAAEDGPELYQGSYLHFSDLQFANLRSIPGWTPGFDSERVEGITTSFSCPNCAAPVNIHAAGLTMSTVCGNCGTLIDTSDERHQILEQANARLLKVRPIIPIGRRGTLRGQEYEMIGFVRRKDLYSSWSEYLLFNPWLGFLWLVTYAGHWTLVERLLEAPTVSGSTVFGAGGKYQLFAKSRSKVDHVLGEFYWQTSVGEVTEGADYVSPPYVVSQEIYPGLAEETWSKGEYLSGEEVAKAFALEKLEEPQGVYLNQPNPFQERWSGIRAAMFGALLLICLVQLFFAVGSNERPILSKDYLFRKADAARVLTTDPFDLPAGSGKVLVRSSAPLANNWIGFDLALLEEKTGKRYEQDLAMEKYSGRDSDGYWTEGKDQAQTSMADVPRGRYRLVIETSADPGISEIPFHISVLRGGLFWSNFWLAFLGASLYPLYLLGRSFTFERARWGESDYGSD